MLTSSYAIAGEAVLEWDASANPETTGYVINYGKRSGDYTERVDVGKVTTYKLKDLDDGKMYYFAVTAYDSARAQSNYSNEASRLVASSDSSGGAVPAPGTVPSSGDGSNDGSGGGVTPSGSSASTGGGGGGCVVGTGVSDFSLLLLAGLALLGLRRSRIERRLVRVGKCRK